MMTSKCMAWPCGWMSRQINQRRPESQVARQFRTQIFGADRIRRAATGLDLSEPWLIVIDQVSSSGNAELAEGGRTMERVSGIGGVFFRAKNPQKLAQWYRDNLGIPEVPETYEEGSWWQESGPTVFTPFNEQSEFLAEYDADLILNFRVSNLDAIVEQLRSAGISIDVDPTVYPNGRFASLLDPEGNPIQLWEPDGTDKTRPESTD